jgi:hypothetical protein
LAKLQEYFRCPVCEQRYTIFANAMKCRNQHLPRRELWVIGKDGKGVKVNEHSAPNSLGSAEWALEEADKSDFINQR